MGEQIVPEPIKLSELDPEKLYFYWDDSSRQLKPMELVHDEAPLSEKDVELDKEHGASGTQIFDAQVEQYDYNPMWRVDSALQVCEQMRKSDGSVRSVLQVVKLPLLRATWKVVPGQEDGGDETDKK